MKNFIEKLKETLNNEYNESRTENGAFGFRTTGKDLLDLNFSVASLRNRNEENVMRVFARSYYSDKLYTLKWLFFAGDVREGLGERRLFRIAMKFLAEAEPQIALALLDFVPEYTRWDNLVYLLDTRVGDKVVEIIKKQLQTDLADAQNKKPISLCAKWMPSINATNNERRLTAKRLAAKLGMTAKVYRQTLSKLRAYSDVTEVKISAKRWAEIDYEKVPSRANLLYADAFLRNDTERREKYLDSLEKGEAKINAAVLFPHDVVHKYVSGFRLSRNIDKTIEALWRALPDYVQGNDSTIVVADGSGSMWSCVGLTNVTALEVADSLAIYFAERCRGEFENKYITFSEHPQLVDMSHCKSLHAKLYEAFSNNEVANTNIEAVFDLILTTAVKNKMKQEDIPQNILIISDMEFDDCAIKNSDVRRNDYISGNDKLFEIIGKKYAEHGYKLPRLIFWNISSRTLTIPVRENALGVALVSGFSPIIVKSVLSGELDPYKLLLEQINVPRYDDIENAVKNLIQ